MGAGILLGARSLGPLAAGVLLVGLSYAGVFPTTLAVAGDLYPKSVGTVFGLLFSVALVGGMMFPWGVGQISQVLGVRYGMAVPLAGGLGIVAISMFLLSKEAPPRRVRA